MDKDKANTSEIRDNPLRSAPLSSKVQELVNASAREFGLHKWLQRSWSQQEPGQIVQLRKKLEDVTAELEYYLDYRIYLNRDDWSEATVASFLENWTSALNEMGQARQRLADYGTAELRNRALDRTEKFRELRDELQRHLEVLQEVKTSHARSEKVVKAFDTLRMVYEWADRIETLLTDGIVGVVADELLDELDNKRGALDVDAVWDGIRAQLDVIAKLQVKGVAPRELYDDIAGLRSDIQATLRDLRSERTTLKDALEELEWLKFVRDVTPYEDQVSIQDLAGGPLDTGIAETNQAAGIMDTWSRSGELAELSCTPVHPNGDNQSDYMSPDNFGPATDEPRALGLLVDVDGDDRPDMISAHQLWGADELASSSNETDADACYPDADEPGNSSNETVCYPDADELGSSVTETDDNTCDSEVPSM